MSGRKHRASFSISCCGILVSFTSFFLRPNVYLHLIFGCGYRMDGIFWFTALSFVFVPVQDRSFNISPLQRHVDVVPDLKQLREIVPQGLVAGIGCLMLPRQRVHLLLPGGDGQLAVRRESVRQLASGHIKLPQLAFMLPPVLLPLALPPDAVHLVKDRL